MSVNIKHDRIMVCRLRKSASHDSSPQQRTGRSHLTESRHRCSRPSSFLRPGRLYLARQDGNVKTPYAENLFLLRWLALAQKQKLFTKIVAQDIAWLLERGRRRGTDANLRKHIEYLYRSCTDVIEEQTDLFRLTYAIETLKERGWQNQLLSAKEWLLPEKVRLPSNGSVLYTEKSALQASFNGEGELQQSLPLLAMGNIDELLRVFQDYGLSLSYVSSPKKTSTSAAKKNRPSR